jgi:hypothetical protein
MPFYVTAEFARPGALILIVPDADDALRRAELLIESGATEVRIKDEAGTLFTVEDLAKKETATPAARQRKAA